MTRLLNGVLGIKYNCVFAGPPDIPKTRANVLREAITDAIQGPDLQAEAEENDRPINFAGNDEADQTIDDAISREREPRPPQMPHRD